MGPTAGFSSGSSRTEMWFTELLKLRWGGTSQKVHYTPSRKPAPGPSPQLCSLPSVSALVLLASPPRLFSKFTQFFQPSPAPIFFLQNTISHCSPTPNSSSFPPWNPSIVHVLTHCLALCLGKLQLVSLCFLESELIEGRRPGPAFFWHLPWCWTQCPWEGGAPWLTQLQEGPGVRAVERLLAAGRGRRWQVEIGKVRHMPSACPKTRAVSACRRARGMPVFSSWQLRPTPSLLSHSRRAHAYCSSPLRMMLMLIIIRLAINSKKVRVNSNVAI